MPRSSRGGLMFNGRPTVPFLWKWYIQNASRERLSDLAQTTSCIRLKGDIIRNLVHLRSLWPHTTKWHRYHGGQTDEVRTRCTQNVKGHLHCDQSVNQSINQSINFYFQTRSPIATHTNTNNSTYTNNKTIKTSWSCSETVLVLASFYQGGSIKDHLNLNLNINLNWHSDSLTVFHKLIGVACV